VSQNQYKYQLDKSSKKHTCPSCGHQRFVLYLNTWTKEWIADFVGRCDREESCQYHYTPKQYFTDNPSNQPTNIERKFIPLAPPKKLSFIPNRYLHASMKQYDINPFVVWLHSIFEKPIVEKLIKRFYIGTSKKYGGSVVFWQVDTDLKIRQAKIMYYDKNTGRRNKKTGAYFAGKNILKKAGVQEPNPKQCLFGLHQLNSDNEKTVAIVESEKTAILMHAFAQLGIAPDYTWLATGGKTGCRWKEAATWKDLKNRKVILYPDMGAYEDWKKQSTHIGTYVHISDLLYISATDKQLQAGFDVADFFLESYESNKK